MSYIVPAPDPVILPTSDGHEFPVRRIYLIGRNYAAHAREMGHDPDREEPFFFTKWPDTIVVGGGKIAYPPKTSDYQFEAELVVALNKGGTNIAASAAQDLIYGYAVGLDMTRRDLQKVAKNLGRPWDYGKNVDQSCPISMLHPVTEIGHPQNGAIWLDQNGARKQDGDLDQLIWSVPEIISILSEHYTLVPGDIIFTGTPAGVGPVVPGDKVVVHVDGLTDLSVEIVLIRNPN